jgi:hypothetical protein
MKSQQNVIFLFLENLRLQEYHWLRPKSIFLFESRFKVVLESP